MVLGAHVAKVSVYVECVRAERGMLELGLDLGRISVLLVLQIARAIVEERS